LFPAGLARSARFERLWFELDLTQLDALAWRDHATTRRYDATAR
jgi:hypothetical protein